MPPIRRHQTRAFLKSQGLDKAPAQRLPAEILQTICDFLPFFDIVRCRGVCKVWRRDIPGNSPTLCETLFLRPDRDESHRTCSFDYGYEIVKYSEHKDNPGFSSPSVFQYEARQLVLSHSRGVRVHPLLHDFPTYAFSIHPNSTPNSTESREPYVPRFSNKEEFARLLEASKFPDGSWEEMFICQPPVLQLSISFNDKDLHKKELSVRIEEGVKISDFIKLYQECMGVCEEQVASCIRRDRPREPEPRKRIKLGSSCFDP